MMSGESKTGLAIEPQCCALCQHRVNVRGQERIVCLAFLSLRLPTQGADCDEFERVRSNAPGIVDA